MNGHTSLRSGEERRIRRHGARNVMGRTSHSPSHDGQCSLWRRMKATAHGSPPRGLLDVGWKVRDLLYLAHLDDVTVLHGRALRPFDCVGPGLHLDDPVAAQHLLGL